jgi:hypothetical protein
MCRNVGGRDRAARLAVGILMTAIGFGALSGGAGVAIGVLGSITLVTGIAGRCALYPLLRRNTYVRV